MDNSNVVELDNHDPSVESVITRLHRHKDKIKSITAIVTWDNDGVDVCHDTKCVTVLSYESMVLQDCVNKKL